MAVVTVPEQVSRPGSGAELQPYGLFTVANGPLDLPNRAIEGGLQFQTPFCGLPDGYAVACSPASKASSLVGGFTTVTGNPFVVLAGMECGSIGIGPSGDPDIDSRDVVINKLRGGEQRTVESIFSRGLFGQAPGLSTAAGTTTVATPTLDNLTNAIQALEGAFGAAYGLPGVIHLPLKASGQFSNGHLGERDNRGVWRTASGNAVSIGNYQGYGPTDVAPADAAHRWIYITGQVTVWRSPDPFISPWEASLNTTTNQVHRFAEREYVVTFECPAFAVLANIEACC